MLSPDMLARLTAWCQDRDVRLVSDEIYHGVAYGMEEATAARSPSAIVVNSFSKYFSMTGWRIGWLVLPDDLLTAVERLGQNLFINAPTVSQYAALAAFDCREELERNVERGYENVVEDLLHPTNERDNLPDDLIRRYHVDQSELRQLDGAGAYWMYQMITTNHPLEEKLALFWHGLFATGYSKLNQARALLNQVDMFKRYGFGSFRDILVELSRDPAMIIWLDNHDNHKDDINENYGRELLELFSMGIDNYPEEDLKGCARAFT